MKYLFSLFVLASGAMTAQEPSYDLVWRPRPNDLLDYKLNLRIEVQDYRFVYDSDLRMVVKKVEGNGEYEVETSTRNSKIQFQDEEAMNPSEPDPVVERFDAKGRRMVRNSLDEGGDEDNDANPVGRILGEVTNFVPPEVAVHKGDKWTQDVSAGTVGKGEKGKTAYEVIGPEKSEGFDVIRVDYTYRQTASEKPVTAFGSFRLKASDFSIVTFDADVQNFRMDEQAPYGMAKLSMKRW